MLATKRRFELKTESKWMSCFVSVADSTVYEVDFTPQSDGLEILTKVCRLLGIVEMDYFGLTYRSGHHGDALWLNLRNRITQELSGRQPYRFEFRVKFFIPAHMIQQDATRHQFYLNISEAYVMGKLHVTDRPVVAQAAALIAHVEGTPCSRSLPEQPPNYSDWLPIGCDWHCDAEMSSLIGSELVKLAGVSRTAAENRLLQLVDGLPMYGASFHSGRDSAGTNVNIAATSDGLVVSEDWTHLNSIPYAAVHRVTNDGCSLLLEVVDDEGATSRHHLKLASRALANALYRAMTELYYFYHCASVGRTVMLQSSRDFKGTLASLFNENTEMGKSYVFDIQRTMREAYDKARRVLFDGGSAPASPVGESSCVAMATRTRNDTGHRDDCTSTCNCCTELRESIEQCRESMRCQLCADADINTAFVPCGHVVCCSDCSLRLDICPLCKADVTQSLKIYLPSDRLHRGSDVTNADGQLCLASS